MPSSHAEVRMCLWSRMLGILQIISGIKLKEEIVASLRKRKDRENDFYLVDFYYRGRRYQISTRTKDKKLAEKIRHEIQGKVARGVFNIAEYPGKDILLGEFLERISKYTSHNRAESTLELQRTYFKKFHRFIGNRSLREIDNFLLDQWKADFLSDHSATTFNIVLRMLHAAFNLAVKWNLLENNPFHNVGKEKVQEKRLFLLNDELARIFQLIDGDINKVSHQKQKRFLVRFRLFVEFLLYTGLRRNEALGLRKEDVDFSQNVVYLNKTKPKKFRVVPLNARARGVLVEAGDELFSRLFYQDVSRKFAHYLKAAGLKGFKLHSLRHTFATMLVSRGVDIYHVSRLLGHSDIKTTMIYGKTSIDALKASVEMLDPVEKSSNQKATIDSVRGLLSTEKGENKRC